MIDLGAARAARREAAGAARDSDGHVPVVVDDEHRYRLPGEVPVDCFGPILDIDLDLSVLLSSGIDPEAVLRDMVVARPRVVADAFEAAKRVLARLFCDEPLRVEVDADGGSVVRHPDSHSATCQWTRFLSEARPSTEDFIDLGRGLLAAYGVNLGERSGSPDQSSSSGGPTLKQTSNDTADSTPAASGNTPETLAS